MKYSMFLKALTELECPICFGEGVVTGHNFKYETCPDCDGLGRKPIPENSPKEILDVFNEG